MEEKQNRSPKTGPPLAIRLARSHEAAWTGLPKAKRFLRQEAAKGRNQPRRVNKEKTTGPGWMRPGQKMTGGHLFTIRTDAPW